MGSPDFRETFLYVAQRLDQYGLAYLHVVDGLEFGFHELGLPWPRKNSARYLTAL
jgi:N-ethylmaleimide reductase